MAGNVRTLLEAWTSAAWTLVWDSAGLICPPVWTPILLWESTEGFACSHRQTLWTRPGSWFDTERCPSDPFYHPTCGRNSAWWQHPLVILSPHQRQVQYTHPSLFISNIEITDRFLGRFLTETCKRFMFVIVLNCLLGEIPAGLSGTAV